MPKRHINPASIGAEPPSYTHAISVTGISETLYISGQVGADPAGTVPADFAAQARLVWVRLEAILSEAGLKKTDIVKTTVYLTDRNDFPVFAEIRKGYLGSHKPASTLVFVSGLARPEYRVEVDAVAVR